MVSEKLLGCLYASAYGDALGYYTQSYSINTIKKKYGGYITELPNNMVSMNNVLSSEYLIMINILESMIINGGKFEEEYIVDAIKNLKSNKVDDPMLQIFINETLNLDKIRLPIYSNPDISDNLLIHNYSATSSPAIFAIAVGLFDYVDEKEYVYEALKICKISHDNSSSFEAACSIASAINEALKQNSTIYSIIESAIKGARFGKKAAIKRKKLLAVPSVERRIELAVKIGITSRNIDEMMHKLSDVVGSGIDAYQSIPTVFGILAFTEGNVEQSLLAGINIGNETRLIASLVGSISGAYEGFNRKYSEKLERIEKSNNLNFDLITKNVNEINTR